MNYRYSYSIFFLKTLCCIWFIFFLNNSSLAQKNNHTITSLVNADHTFLKLIAHKGINSGFTKMADNKAITFNPNPVNIKNYYSTLNKNLNIYSWQTATATLAKSGDFGITTGPFVDSRIETADLFYGNYISVWQSDERNNWMLTLHIDVPSPKLNIVSETKLFVPYDEKYSKLLGPKKIKMREDIVFSTDELLGKALNLTGNKSFKEFYSSNVKVYISGYQPLDGIDEVFPFLSTQKTTIVSHPLNTNRAYSGDLAYTYGEATLTQNNQKLKYSYVRIWQIQPDMKWYIIMDAYIPFSPTEQALTAK
jgi:hypothetical protein